MSRCNFPGTHVLIGIVAITTGGGIARFRSIRNMLLVGTERLAHNAGPAGFGTSSALGLIILISNSSSCYCWQRHDGASTHPQLRSWRQYDHHNICMLLRVQYIQSTVNNIGGLHSRGFECCTNGCVIMMVIPIPAIPRPDQADHLQQADPKRVIAQTLILRKPWGGCSDTGCPPTRFVSEWALPFLHL